MTQKPENHHDGVPVSQAILAKRLFLPAIPKKKHFDQNTQLCVGFAKIKSFHSQKHTVLSRFRKQIDAIRNKTENSQVPC